MAEVREQARAVSWAKNRFIANISHEFKTPLTVINGFAEVLLEEECGPLNDEQKKFVSQIAYSGEHLLAIVNDLLDLARIEAGQMEITLAPVDLGKVCNEAADMMESRLQTRGLSLVRDLPEGEALAYGDHLRLKQVMLNLLSNALKFTPQGTVTIWLAEQDGRMEFGVQDTGIGIEEQDLERVFLPFEQVQNKLTTAEKGTGLGLALCREIVEAQGGSIRVESKPGEGSNFIVSIPTEKGSDA